MIKIRYVALLEVEDEIEQNGNILTVDEIRQNAQNDMVKDALRDLIARGFMKPKITIIQQFADVIEVEEQ